MYLYYKVRRKKSKELFAPGGLDNRADGGYNYRKRRKKGCALIYIGCHLSVSGGFAAMGETMLSLGGNTFAYFTRNPRGGKTKDLIPADADALNALLAKAHFGPTVAHGSYTMNLCAANEQTRRNALDMLEKDLCRMAYFPGSLYNFHPGSHTGQGMETGIQLIADALNAVLTPDTKTTVLLETMAGKGSEVGGRFEELREIIDRVEQKEKLGVCFDTCHVWDAGYDLVHDLDGVLTQFDRVIGLDRLRAVRLCREAVRLYQTGHHTLALRMISGAFLLDPASEPIRIQYFRMTGHFPKLGLNGIRKPEKQP